MKLLEIYQKNKLTFIALFILLILLILAFVFHLITPQPPSPTPTPTPIPTISSQYQGPLPTNINFTLTEADIILPDYLTLYSVSPGPQITSSEARQIAQNLNFTSEPQLLNDQVQGDIYIWSNPEIGILKITSSLGTINYQTSRPPTGKFPTNYNQDQLIETARDFIETNQFLTGPFEFSEFRVLSLDNYQIYSQDQSLAEFEIAIVSFRENIDEYPLFNTTTEIGTVSVIFNDKLEIMRVYIDRGPDIQPLGKYPVKSYQQIIDSLPEAKIQTLDYGNIFPGEITQDLLTSIDISSATIGYLQEEMAQHNILQPILSLQGTATLNNGDKISITLFLPALTTIIAP